MPLDLTRCQTTGGIFTEHCVVVAEGELVDGTFEVNTMGFPPPEPRSHTMRLMADINIIGGTGGDTGGTVERQKMKDMEAAATDSMFVVLSDVHLDKPQVMEKIAEVRGEMKRTRRKTGDERGAREESKEEGKQYTVAHSCGRVSSLSHPLALFL